MVKCLICNVEKPYSIVEHLRCKHKLSVEAYRKQFANAEVKSALAIEAISKQHKLVWQDESYKQKMRASRQRTHRTDEFRKKQSDIIKSTYAHGHRTWNDGLTKDSDERLSLIGKKNSEHLTGRTKDTHDYLKGKSVFMKKFHEDNPGVFVHNRINWSEERIKEWKEKISSSVCEAYHDGRCGSSYRYIKGWFETKDSKREHYDSSWELSLMEFLESLNVTWTKAHRITIDYQFNGNRRYIPDFLISWRGKNLLLELKGYVSSQIELDEKTQAAKIWSEKQNMCFSLCHSVNEAKDVICKFMTEANETSKNC